MKNRYNCVMEHIQVTPEMHARIMITLETNKLIHKPTKDVGKHRKYLSIAACIVILLVGTLVIGNIVDLTQQPPTVVPEIVEYSSVHELSKGVGFRVREIQEHPFDAEQVQYYAYWSKLAEIVYTGGDITLVFRMSAGSDDNSGDYNDYSDVKSCPLGDYTVTLKGGSNHYSLAVWESGGYSYSVNFSSGISQEEMLEVIQSVQ